LLPDFAELKSDISKAVNIFARQRAQQHAGVLKGVKARRQFEGSSNSIVRPGEAEEQTEMVALGSEILIPLDDLHQMSLLQVMERHDAAVKDIVEQQTRHFFAFIHKTTEKTGNVVDGKGRRFSVELLIETIDKMHMDFRADGSPIMPTIVVSPQQMDDIRASEAALQNDLELQKKFDDMISRKREEWRAREADRILVG